MSTREDAAKGQDPRSELESRSSKLETGFKPETESDPEIARLTIPLEDTDWIIEKSNAALEVLYRELEMENVSLQARVRERTEELRELSRALRESEKHYRLLADNVTDIIWTTDNKLRLTYVTPSVSSILGYGAEEVIQRRLKDIVPPPALEVATQSLAEEIAAGEAEQKDTHGPRVLELELRRKDGSKVWTESRTTTLRDSDGQLVGLLGATRDIGDRKQAQQLLQTSEARLHVMVRQNADGIIVADEDGIVQFANPAAEALFNRTQEDLHGELFGFPLVAGETTELDLVRRDGERAVAEMRVVEMEWEGEPAYLASLRDITDRKRAEEELERHFLSLAEAVSHASSLRSPYGATHQRGTGELVQTVAERMGMDEQRLQNLYIGALLHDIGKMGIPEGILRRPGKLTEDEYALVRTHTQRGYHILRDTDLPELVAELALHHHEQLDGSGYPDGLKGDELSKEVRILAVCNVVDAMSSHRPWRVAHSREEILEEIKRGQGAQYDPDVVDVLVEMIESGELELAGSIDEAAGGETVER